MKITMTLREALEIQARQVAHYSKYRSDLAQVVAAKTNVEGYSLDEPMSVIDVNRLVPRGDGIEYMCGLSDVQRIAQQEHRAEIAKRFMDIIYEKNLKK
jgi:hypothetical protein